MLSQDQRGCSRSFRARHPLCSTAEEAKAWQEVQHLVGLTVLEYDWLSRVWRWCFKSTVVCFFPSVLKIPQHGAANRHKVSVLLKRLLKWVIKQLVGSKLETIMDIAWGENSKLGGTEITVGTCIFSFFFSIFTVSHLLNLWIFLLPVPYYPYLSCPGLVSFFFTVCFFVFSSTLCR